MLRCVAASSSIYLGRQLRSISAPFDGAIKLFELQWKCKQMRQIGSSSCFLSLALSHYLSLPLSVTLFRALSHCMCSSFMRQSIFSGACNALKSQKNRLNAQPKGANTSGEGGKGAASAWVLHLTNWLTAQAVGRPQTKCFISTPHVNTPPPFLSLVSPAS